MRVPRGARRRAPSLDTRLERVMPVLIGLWRFRYKGNHPNWCCTWCYRGLYYDTYPKATPGEALDAVYRNWRKRRRGKR